MPGSRGDKLERLRSRPITPNTRLKAHSTFLEREGQWLEHKSDEISRADEDDD